MRVLVVGGSGYVGTMVMPHLKQDFDVRVFDVVPPRDPSVEYVEGSVHDPAALRRAMEGMEALVYMVMGRNPDGTYASHDLDLNYDLHVKGLHRALQAAVEAKILRAVHTSTLSVHGGRPNGVYEDESTPADAGYLYGFAKWLGELVCDYFARVHGMTVVSLRLCGPTPLEDWHKQCRPGQPVRLTAAPDVASAIALSLRAPLTGSHAVFIAGDYEGKAVNCARAKQLLGWEPRERPRAAS